MECSSGIKSNGLGKLPNPPYLLDIRKGRPENERCLVAKRASFPSLFGKSVGKADALDIQAVIFQEDITRELQEIDTLFLTLLPLIGAQVFGHHKGNQAFIIRGGRNEN